MGATSRRRFLSGAAAATAGVACATVNAAAAAGTMQTGSVDTRVAFDFFNWPRHQDKENQGGNHAAWLLYGLVCMDVKSQELLLPNPAGVPNVSAHNARLWVLKSSIVDSAQFSTTEKGDDSSGLLTYFTIAGYKLQLAALDAARNQISDTTPDLKWRNSTQQPWRHSKWVRSLKAQTGKALIPAAQRDDRSLVTTRVELKGGTVTAVPPFSTQGQHAEWRSQLADGSIVVGATTDSMLWTRPFSSRADRLRVTFVDRLGASKTLLLRMSTTGLLAALTHSTDMPHSIPTQMTDSTAFARLLVGNNPATFPVPVLEGLQRPAALGSSDDVHCEGGRP